MWKRLATDTVNIACSPPFSFYFDIVREYFRAATNTQPLHRICTLTRKQRATWLVAECALDRPDVQEEIEHLDRRYGGGGEASATALSFFKNCHSANELRDSPEAEANLLAHAVIINYRSKRKADFSHSYVFEAILAPIKNSFGNGHSGLLLNNFVAAEGHFERTILGRVFALKGVYYCQQNDTTHVCGHACLRMAINSAGQFAKPISNVGINRFLGITRKVKGLTSGQMEDVIADAGLNPLVITKLKPEHFLPELASIVESGYLALLGFTTKRRADHVVTVFGHTRNSDEWHPQAIPAYSGPSSAKYLPSGSWIDHFLIHDDNFGPHFSLSARSFDLHTNVKPSCLIGLLPAEPVVHSNYAEGLASSTLKNLLQQFEGRPMNKWLDYMAIRPQDFVLRAILMKGSQYFGHLKGMTGHDGTLLDDLIISKLEWLPEYFWMVEYSLPPLYTGNRTKLGEVLITAADSKGYRAGHVLAVRLPGLVLRSQGTTFDGLPSDLRSHSPIYECRQFDNYW
ncbi:hypothetical protein XH99_14030 [Bradyrhizobium nanningense]|uniref:Uncharacterized protein n=1 Tax=Bradyrhizobium nanningense TaxID=1325118 RepID=A0A4Q0S6X9_9BRAD|nr:hypothetical protein [Bradyrhizobium nanningense]RXH28927.1 hypothetical protein XH99_14030 [Bradyrhizobium nanningense]